MSKSKTLVAKIVNKLTGIDKRRKDFLISLFSTLLSFQGRHNFSNLVRYGKYCEKTFRLNYEKVFDGLFGQIPDNLIIEATWLGSFEPYEKGKVSSLIYEMMIEKNQKK